MNPSFKPPPPISDAVKTQIFNAYMTKGKNEVELGKAYGLSVSRVKAILRLKKLEQLWQKVRWTTVTRAMMSIKRLVFKTSSWLNPLYMHGFLIPLSRSLRAFN